MKTEHLQSVHGVAPPPAKKEPIAVPVEDDEVQEIPEDEDSEDNHEIEGEIEVDLVRERMRQKRRQHFGEASTSEESPSKLPRIEANPEWTDDEEYIDDEMEEEKSDLKQIGDCKDPLEATKSDSATARSELKGEELVIDNSPEKSKPDCNASS